jgi:hypothetical protein
LKRGKSGQENEGDSGNLGMIDTPQGRDLRLTMRAAHGSSQDGLGWPGFHLTLTPAVHKSPALQPAHNPAH